MAIPNKVAIGIKIHKLPAASGETPYLYIDLKPRKRDFKISTTQRIIKNIEKKSPIAETLT